MSGFDAIQTTAGQVGERFIINTKNLGRISSFLHGRFHVLTMRCNNDGAESYRKRRYEGSSEL